MKRTRASLALAAAAVLLSTAGCGVAQQVGAAAIVEGQPVPVDRGQQLATELRKAGGDVDPQTGRGTLVVDLNLAYHPSCAYDPAWACPLAPPGNVLGAPVDAGEQLPPGGWY